VNLDLGNCIDSLLSEFLGLLETFKVDSLMRFYGLFMILSYSLDIRHVPLQIIFSLFYVFIFKFYHLG
jgi:hypothetical protein